MSRHKARRKGGARERVFGCDLLQLLQRSGQDGECGGHRPHRGQVSPRLRHRCSSSAATGSFL